MTAVAWKKAGYAVDPAAQQRRAVYRLNGIDPTTGKWGKARQEEQYIIRMVRKSGGEGEPGTAERARR